MTRPTKDEIIAKAEELRWEIDREYIGVRTQEQTFTLGPIDHVSNIWDDGEDTGEELDGLSVTDYEHPAVAAHTDAGYQFSRYLGEHIALIGFDSFEFGEDEGELIASGNAEVIHIFC